MKIFMALVVVAFSFAASPCLAQKAAPAPVTPAKDAAPSTDAPKLTAEQRDKMRSFQVQIQSLQLKAYQNRDLYNEAQRQIDEQAQTLSKQYEDSIAEVCKPVGDKNFLFNRGTLNCDAVKPEPPKPADPPAAPPVIK